MKVFISYDYDNDRDYKNMLLAWAKNNSFSDINFNDGSADISINSTDKSVIQRAISAKINASDKFLCLVGKNLKRSNWVKWEIAKAVELKKKIIAVKIESTNESPAELLGVGAIWAMSFTYDAIEKALNS
jgi:hypothetical protein